jgi:hypothetical protein
VTDLDEKGHGMYMGKYAKKIFAFVRKFISKGSSSGMYPQKYAENIICICPKIFIESK